MRAIRGGLFALAAAALASWIVACARPYPHAVFPSMAVGEPSFFPTLEAYAQAPIVGGNRIDILLNGDQLFPAMLEAVRSAKKTINYAQYTYEEGPVGREFAEALAERCRAGVTVNVLLDGFGTIGMPPEYTTLLTQAGCHVATFRPLDPFAFQSANHRNHRRILVVDGRVGFTGGSGIGAAWMGDGRTGEHWRNTDLRMEGRAVEYLQGAFVENWLEATGVVLGGEDFFPRPVEPMGQVYAQVVRSSPSAGSFGLYTTFLLAISSAQHSIHVTNPYFVPDADMLDALVQAAGRGVRVLLLIPGVIDHILVKPASRREFGRLFQAGVEIYEYQPALLHAKTMTIDGRWSTIGSANFDNRSFALNDELSAVIYSRDVAAGLDRAFADDLLHAKKLEYGKWRRRGLMERLFELFTIPLHDFL
ncbi:MAG TPA: phospholipase D-like domain-containing protein [Candidatus Acidoferrum sp.]|nr:phospholipase D-like domain-containing protein [Candidatus Acidoferrum sp.]